MRAGSIISSRAKKKRFRVVVRVRDERCLRIDLILFLFSD
jgi:hypothetical protein